MCVQLWMRPLSYKDHPFRGQGRRFEAYLGCRDVKARDKNAFTIILVTSGLGPGHYRRLVHQNTDLQTTELDTILKSVEQWTLKNVFISNPRPSLSTQPPSWRDFYPISLNLSAALKSGVEIWGFWAYRGPVVKAEKTILPVP
jgi:hypothetical protein